MHEILCAGVSKMYEIRLNCNQQPMYERYALFNPEKTHHRMREIRFIAVSKMPKFRLNYNIYYNIRHFTVKVC